MLYNDADGYHFMDQETFENVTLQRDLIGEPGRLPQRRHGRRRAVPRRAFRSASTCRRTSSCKIVETDPGFKGDTATNTTKPAKLETGATVQVPLFVETGNVIRIDTRDRRYIGRAQAKRRCPRRLRGAGRRAAARRARQRRRRHARQLLPLAHAAVRQSHRRLSRCTSAALDVRHALGLRRSRRTTATPIPISAS